MSATRQAIARRRFRSIALVSAVLSLVIYTLSQGTVRRCSSYRFSSIATATSGTLFKMNAKISEKQGDAKHNPSNGDYDPTNSGLAEETCSIRIVGVVTTVASTNQVYEIFRNFLKSYDNAHLVVTLDDGFDVGSFAQDLVGQARIHILTLEDQNRMYPNLSLRMPLNHFSRKNIGYLHAIAIGACFIWDFDDDNDGSNIPLLHSLNKMDISDQHAILNPFLDPIACIFSASGSINPYLMFGPERFVWPRGFPIEDTKERLFPRIGSIDRCGNNTIDIIQVIQTINPDVDGIWRLQNRLPLRWLIPHLLRNNSILAVNAHNFAPYNAQSTLVSRKAFWSLYLPFTVHGRVSDIWRSYFKQAVAPVVGGLSGFMEPNVSHRRNYHNNLADFNAEQPLYERSGELIRFLSNNRHGFGLNGDALDALVRVYSAVGLNGLFDIRMEDELEGVLAWAHALRSLTHVPPVKNADGTLLPKEGTPIPSKDILQVVQINHGWMSNIPIIEALVSTRYKKVFYAPGIDSCVQISGLPVHCLSDAQDGYYAQESLIHAFKNYGEYTYYIFAHDDAVIRETSLVNFLRENKSAIPSFGAQDMSDVRESEARIVETLKHLREWQSACRIYGTEPHWKRASAHFLIATRDSLQLIMPDLIKMRWAEAVMENTVPTLLSSCTREFNTLFIHTRWDDRRGKPSTLVNEFCASSSDVVHPVKLSSIEGFNAYLKAMTC